MTIDTTKRQPCAFLGKLIRFLLEPFMDDVGSLSSIVRGFCILFVLGTLLGVVVPANSDLPTPFWRVASSVIGYTYCLCWTVSWYPQAILNWKRKSTVGLSVDAWSLDVVGYLCYAAYTCALFWSPSIRQSYEMTRGETITVQSNDVAFAVHSLILSLVWVGQIGWYNHGLHSMSHTTVMLMGGIVILCGVCVFLVLVKWWTWLDYLYLLSFIKTCITVVVYIPQVVLNHQRKSTVGWSVWNVLLDLLGGMLSMIQLVGDAIDMGEWSESINGNLAKLGISLISIFFNVVFLVQHYVLYPSTRVVHDLDYEVLL